VGVAARGSRFLVLDLRFLTRYGRDPSRFCVPPGQLQDIDGGQCCAGRGSGWAICGSLGEDLGSRFSNWLTSNIDPKLGMSNTVGLSQGQGARPALFN